MPKFDALQLCKDHSIPYEIDGTKNSGAFLGIQCPICGHDGFYGGINTLKGYYTCWACGSSPLPKVIGALLQISYSSAKELMQEYWGYNSLKGAMSSKADKVCKATHIDLPGDKLNKWHKKYLEKRNFDPEYLERKYGLRGTGPVCMWNKSDFSKRIIIPFYDQNQDLVSFQGRDYTNRQTLRYKGAPLEFCKENYKHLLYNINNASYDRVCLLEGAPDVWRMGDGFIASFGISLTSKQIKLLSMFKEVLIMFDPEDVAQIQAEKILKELSCLGVSCENITMDSGGRDAGELTPQEAKEIRRDLGFY